ncbi:hypothetical protein ACVW0P_001435 [Mucilaginibacter sp. UYNi724]
MAENKKEAKPRAEQYDPKVKFDGTLEQMIKIAVKPQIQAKDKAKK